MPPLIECDRISVKFASSTALEDISLSIDSNSWTTIVGPSASGKTTLLRAIAGLQPLSDGTLSINGKLASNSRIAMAPHQRGIGYLPQGQSLWPHLSARANVELAVPPSIKGRMRRTNSDKWLDRLKLAHVSSRFPSELSGGEARGVSLARALAAEPKILLLDEPTAHLDLHLRESLMTLIHELHSELRLTTLCVTHQIELPMNISDRIVICERGKILLDGRLSSLAEAPQTDFVLALRRSIGRLGIATED